MANKNWFSLDESTGGLHFSAIPSSVIATNSTHTSVPKRRRMSTSNSISGSINAKEKNEVESCSIVGAATDDDDDDLNDNHYYREFVHSKYQELNKNRDRGNDVPNSEVRLQTLKTMGYLGNGDGCTAIKPLAATKMKMASKEMNRIIGMYNAGFYVFATEVPTDDRAFASPTAAANTSIVHMNEEALTRVRSCLKRYFGRDVVNHPHMKRSQQVTIEGEKGDDRLGRMLSRTARVIASIVPPNANASKDSKNGVKMLTSTLAEADVASGPVLSFVKRMYAKALGRSSSSTMDYARILKYILNYTMFYTYGSHRGNRTITGEVIDWMNSFCGVRMDHSDRFFEPAVTVGSGITSECLNLYIGETLLSFAEMLGGCKLGLRDRLCAMRPDADAGGGIANKNERRQRLYFGSTLKREQRLRKKRRRKMKRLRDGSGSLTATRRKYYCDTDCYCHNIEEAVGKVIRCNPENRVKKRALFNSVLGRLPCLVVSFGNVGVRYTNEKNTDASEIQKKMELDKQRNFYERERLARNNWSMCAHYMFNISKNPDPNSIKAHDTGKRSEYEDIMYAKEHLFIRRLLHLPRNSVVRVSRHAKRRMLSHRSILEIVNFKLNSEAFPLGIAPLPTHVAIGDFTVKRLRDNIVREKLHEFPITPMTLNDLEKDVVFGTKLTEAHIDSLTQIPFVHTAFSNFESFDPSLLNGVSAPIPNKCWRLKKRRLIRFTSPHSAVDDLERTKHNVQMLPQIPLTVSPFVEGGSLPPDDFVSPSSSSGSEQSVSPCYSALSKIKTELVDDDQDTIIAAQPDSTTTDDPISSSPPHVHFKQEEHDDLNEKINGALTSLYREDECACPFEMKEDVSPSSSVELGMENGRYEGAPISDWTNVSDSKRYREEQGRHNSPVTPCEDMSPHTRPVHPKDVGVTKRMVQCVYPPLGTSFKRRRRDKSKKRKKVKKEKRRKCDGSSGSKKTKGEKRKSHAISGDEESNSSNKKAKLADGDEKRTLFLKDRRLHIVLDEGGLRDVLYSMDTQSAPSFVTTNTTTTGVAAATAAAASPPPPPPTMTPGSVGVGEGNRLRTKETTVDYPFNFGNTFATVDAISAASNATVLRKTNANAHSCKNRGWTGSNNISFAINSPMNLVTDVVDEATLLSVLEERFDDRNDGVDPQPPDDPKERVEWVLDYVLSKRRTAVIRALDSCKSFAKFKRKLCPTPLSEDATKKYREACNEEREGGVASVTDAAPTLQSNRQLQPQQQQQQQRLYSTRLPPLRPLNLHLATVHTMMVKNLIKKE